MKVLHLILVLHFFTFINGKLDRNSNSLDFEHHILPRPRKTIEPEELQEPAEEVKVESTKLISLMVSFDLINNSH